jgi:ferredoxin-NADP reductase
MSSMEAKRDLLLVAIGTQGIAPIRAVLDWIPVQAHATSQKVTLVYEVENAQSAAYVAEWDAWRAAGVNVIPVYKDALSEVRALASPLLLTDHHRADTCVCVLPQFVRQRGERDTARHRVALDWARGV